MKQPIQIRFIGVDAFDDMTRQAEDSVRRLRGQEKMHAPALRGEAVRFADDGHCGFIRTTRGDEYWFGPDNIAGSPFEHLALRDPLQFVPEVAAEGRQARRVSVGKHHAP